MQISVRYIPTDYHKGTDGRVTASGNKPALCFITDEEARCVINTEEGVELVKLPVCDVKSSPPVGGYINDEEAAQKFLQFYNVTLKKQKAIEDGVQELMDLVGTAPTEFPTDKSLSKKPAKAKVPKKKSTGPSLISILAEELKITPPKIRKALREAGLTAPYDDEKKIRAALTDNGAKK